VRQQAGKQTIVDIGSSHLKEKEEEKEKAAECGDCGHFVDSMITVCLSVCLSSFAGPILPHSHSHSHSHLS
jgi:hypothetical protein